MPLVLKNAAFTSSSAFFIDAAANTMMAFSWAVAGFAESARAAIAKRKTRRHVMAVLRSRGVTHELSRYWVGPGTAVPASKARAQRAWPVHPSDLARHVKSRCVLSGARD